MNRPETTIETSFERFAALIERDPLWRAERDESVAEFAPGGRLDPASHGAPRRHLEWFLLERVVGTEPGLGIERLAARWPEETGLDDPAALQRYLHSLTGVFEVTSVAPGEGVWLRDLSTGGEFPVLEEAGSHVLQRGDVLAGRLFPSDGGVHVVSSAAAFFRDERLLDALRRDLESARAARRGVVRVGQREIEAMFFGGGAAAEDPIAAARKLLAEGGIDAAQTQEWLDELAQAPFDEDRLVHGAHDVLAGILDRLAFETSIDLESARRVLLLAWADLARRGAGSGASLKPTPSPALAASSSQEIEGALARFEARRKSGEPLGTLLTELERDLALGEDPDEEQEESDIPDFPGVVGAMVDEFLWETGREHGDAAAARHASLRGLARSARSVGVFENFSTRDLLAYAAFWLPESGELETSDQAQAALASLQAFTHWVEDAHDLPLHTEFRETAARLARSLPRVTEANRRRTRAAPESEGELFEIVEANSDSVLLLARTGREVRVRIDPTLVEWLRPGDRVRGRVDAEQRLAVYCVYPPEVAALGESSSS